MVRVGASPMKGVETGIQTAPVTVVVVTCIPEEKGYYASRFAVLKVCLQSIVRHADGPIDLLVVDNASSDRVVDYLVQLKKDGIIQYLILNNRNIGLGGAWNLAFSAAPGEFISFTNDDIFFYPGWLSQQRQILEQFPRAGMVCGQLIQGDGPHDQHVTVAQQSGLKITPFDYPREWLERWCRNIGRDVEESLRSPTVLATRNYLLEKNGVKAFAGANGYAWTFRKSILAELGMLPFPAKTFHGKMDDHFQGALTRAGYLSYATFDRTNDHIGNVLDEFWHNEAKRFGITPEDPAASSSHKADRWTQWPVVRKGAKALLRVSLNILQRN